jgi:hypothetical protein
VRRGILLAGSLAVLAVAPSGAAQDEPRPGEIHGRVLDGSGACVAGAEVRVTSSGGGLWTAVAGTEGGFVLTGVPPGAYRVEASLAGLGEAVAEEVQIARSRAPAARLTLVLPGLEGGLQLSVAPARGQDPGAVEPPRLQGAMAELEEVQRLALRDFDGPRARSSQSAGLDTALRDALAAIGRLFAGPGVRKPPPARPAG